MKASASPDAAAIVSSELVKRPPADRARFLRELLAHVAAGLVVIEGNEAAGEACYRLADAVVARGARGGQ